MARLHFPKKQCPRKPLFVFDMISKQNSKKKFVDLSVENLLDPLEHGTSPAIFIFFQFRGKLSQNGLEVGHCLLKSNLDPPLVVYLLHVSIYFERIWLLFWSYFAAILVMNLGFPRGCQPPRGDVTWSPKSVAPKKWTCVQQFFLKNCRIVTENCIKTNLEREVPQLASKSNLPPSPANLFTRFSLISQVLWEY